MLEIRAIVIKVQGSDASVQPIGTGGCLNCTKEGGCGSGALTKLFCNNAPRHFNVRNDIHAKIGDEIQISLPEGILLRGAMKMYMLPLSLLLLGGLCGVSFAGETGSRDAYAVVGASIGLLAGFVFARLSPSLGRPVASSIIISQSRL